MLVKRVLICLGLRPAFGGSVVCVVVLLYVIDSFIYTQVEKIWLSTLYVLVFFAGFGAMIS